MATSQNTKTSGTARGTRKQAVKATPEAEAPAETVEAEAPAEVIEPAVVRLHTVVGPDGTEYDVAVRNYPKAVRYDPKWAKGGPKLPGHDAGDYSDNKDQLVQKLAYEYRASGLSVNAGYQGLKLQCGAHLQQAAVAWAKANELAEPTKARAAAVAARQAEKVEVSEEDAAAIAPKVKADA